MYGVSRCASPGDLTHTDHGTRVHNLNHPALQQNTIVPDQFLNISRLL